VLKVLLHKSKEKAGCVALPMQAKAVIQAVVKHQLLFFGTL